jgi:DNA polymerase-1
MRQSSRRRPPDPPRWEIGMKVRYRRDPSGPGAGGLEGSSSFAPNTPDTPGSACQDDDRTRADSGARRDVLDHACRRGPRRVKRILLIDGDILAYKFAAANEQTIDWGEGVSRPTPTSTDAKANLDEHIKSHSSWDSTPTTTSSPSRTRRTSARTSPVLQVPSASARSNPSSAGNWRTTSARPTPPSGSRGWRGTTFSGSSRRTRSSTPSAEKIIVSDDKDMQTIPCTLYRQGELRRDREEADYYHLFQTLTGDRTDGYPGCPSVGPVKAAKWLLREPAARSRTLWWHVESSTASSGSRPSRLEDALLQARLARILRHEDYDYQRKEPKLWR